MIVIVVNWCLFTLRRRCSNLSHSINP